jgi:hypothetical protein
LYPHYAETVIFYYVMRRIPELFYAGVGEKQGALKH